MHATAGRDSAVGNQHLGVAMRDTAVLSPGDVVSDIAALAMRTYKQKYARMACSVILLYPYHRTHDDFTAPAFVSAVNDIEQISRQNLATM
jgi:hypothetical protein